MPRPLLKRGHRLVFSNAIILLTVLAVALLLATGGSVSALVPLFAMGVFSAFAMAGYGMAKHQLSQRDSGWRRKLMINLSAGLLSTIVVLIFAVAKFTEGAWLIVVVFPTLVFLLIRLNKQYRAEASVLEMSAAERPDMTMHASHRVLVFIDSIDLAEVETMRYAKGLHADRLTAVHFVLDEARAARLQVRWQRFGESTELRMVDCEDRRLGHAAQQLVAQIKDDHPDSTVTVLLPRRMYSPLGGRLLHDRTADMMARLISRIPGASAQILAYDVGSRVARTLWAADSKDRGRSGETTGRAQATTQTF